MGESSLAPDRAAVPLSRYVLFGGIAVLGCAADLLTKHYIFAWRGMPRPDNIYWLMEGFVGIETSVNHGALFGMGQGKAWLFALLSVAAAIGIPYWLFARRAAHDLLLTIALGSVMGGIFGNLYDRAGVWHVPGTNESGHNAVRDWILFCWGEQYKWPNFNIADCLLVCGAGLLVWHAFTAPNPQVQQESGAS